MKFACGGKCRNFFYKIYYSTSKYLLTSVSIIKECFVQDDFY